MKTTFTFFFCVIFFSAGFSQNYQSIYADRINSFETDYSIIKFVRVDSTKSIDGMTHLYLFKNIQENVYCTTPYGASWMGKEMVINNHWNLFFNLLGDTIRIKTDAVLNDSWAAYSLKDSTTILAQVVKHDTMSFLGLEDSVKTISFQAYDNKMNKTDHSINNQTIALSKNYGLVNTLNFLLFPSYVTHDLNGNGSLKKFTLAGSSKPKVGIQNLTWFEVNDFSVGDELHTVFQMNDFLPSGNSGVTHMNSSIIKFLARQNYKDSIIYKAEREEMDVDNYYYPDSSVTKYIHDTITIRIFSDSLFDHLPDEPINSSYNAYVYFMSAGREISKVQSPDGFFTKVSNDSCFLSPLVDGCISDQTFYKGLGGPYTSCSNGALYSENNQLVYYKKGSKTWGTPLVITAVESSQNTGSESVSSILLFPNPVKDQLTVKIQNFNIPSQFELMDAQGNVQLSTEIHSVETTISLEHLTAGIFFYKIRDLNNQVKSGKIVKF